MRLLLAVAPSGGAGPMARVVFSFDPTVHHSIALLTGLIASDLQLIYEPALFLSDDFWLPPEASISSVLCENDRITVRQPDLHPLAHLRASRCARAAASASNTTNEIDLELPRTTELRSSSKRSKSSHRSVPDCAAAALRLAPTAVLPIATAVAASAVQSATAAAAAVVAKPRPAQQLVTVTAIDCSTFPPTSCEPTPERLAWAESSQHSKTRRGNRKRGRGQGEQAISEQAEEEPEHAVLAKAAEPPVVPLAETPKTQTVHSAKEPNVMPIATATAPGLKSESQMQVASKGLPAHVVPIQQKKEQGKREYETYKTAELKTVPAKKNEQFAGHARFTKELAYNVPAGTRLAFKMLELGAERTPEISRDFRVGTVLSQAGEKIKMELDAESCPKTNEWSLDYGDSVNENQVTLSVGDMVEPVIVSWGKSKRAKRQ